MQQDWIIRTVAIVVPIELQAWRAGGELRFS